MCFRYIFILTLFGVGVILTDDNFRNETEVADAEDYDIPVSGEKTDQEVHKEAEVSTTNPVISYVTGNTYGDKGCQAHQWTCDNGQCIYAIQHCDFIPDCDDSSDEVDCLRICSDDEFPCDGHRCIPLSHKCNLRRDCLDWTDEKDCAKPFTANTTTTTTGPKPSHVYIFPSPRQTAREGDTITFFCVMKKSEPGPTLSWSRTDGKPLQRNVDVSSPGRLRFTAITVEEEGEYECKAENEFGETSARAAIIVYSPPKITISPSTNVTANAGDRVQLECTAEGHPKPSVEWIKFNNSASGRLEGLPFAVYAIPEVTAADSGFYICRATNQVGVMEDRVEVTIISSNSEIDRPLESGDIVGEDTGPSNGISAVFDYQNKVAVLKDVLVIVENGDGELTCNADGAAPIQVMWRMAGHETFPDNVVAHGGRLMIRGARKDNAGEYICHGSDGQGRPFEVLRRLEVKAPPRIALTNQTARPGDFVRVNCTVISGNEPIAITWFRDDKKPLHPAVVVGSELLFHSITVNDTGRYVCQAKNKYGEADGVMDVIVAGKPELNACPSIQNKTFDMNETRANPLSTAWKLYDSFMKALRGGPSIDLDHMDCDDEEILEEYRNFEPTRIMELLIARAAVHNTSAEIFHKEMKTLVASLINATQENVDNIKNETWYKNLLRLEQKYSVTRTSSTEPAAITSSRLCLMFPQHSAFLKPGVPLSLDEKHYTGFPVEFGGLIPRGPILKQSEKGALIVVHLFVLQKQFRHIPFRTHQMLLKRRIQSGLLSDENRFRILENHGLITRHGELQGGTKEIFDYIKRTNPDNILNNIRWDLINNV